MAKGIRLVKLIRELILVGLLLFTVGKVKAQEPPSNFDLLNKEKVKITVSAANPNNAYGLAEADVWSGTSYTTSSKCTLLIFAACNLLGYAGGTILLSSTWIADGDNTHLSSNSVAQWTMFEGANAYYSNVTAIGYKTGLTRGQTITIKIRGSASIANRCKLANVELFVLELSEW